MLPEDILKQYESYCNRKVSIHCDRRYEMVRVEFYVSLRKRAFISTKMVAGALLCTSEVGGMGGSCYGNTNAWRNEEGPGGASPSFLMQWCDGTI